MHRAGAYIQCNKHLAGPYKCRAAQHTCMSSLWPPVWLPHNTLLLHAPITPFKAVPMHAFSYHAPLSPNPTSADMSQLLVGVRTHCNQCMCVIRPKWRVNSPWHACLYGTQIMSIQIKKWHPLLIQPLAITVRLCGTVKYRFKVRSGRRWGGWLVRSAGEEKHVVLVCGACGGGA